jgi:hypothetical protein
MMARRSLGDAALLEQNRERGQQIEIGSSYMCQLHTLFLTFALGT